MAFDLEVNMVFDICWRLFPTPHFSPTSILVNISTKNGLNKFRTDWNKVGLKESGELVKGHRLGF